MMNCPLTSLLNRQLNYASELSSIILILQTFQSHPLHLQHSLEAQL